MSLTVSQRTLLAYISHALFQTVPLPADPPTQEVWQEALAQAVLPLLASVTRPDTTWEPIYRAVMATNLNISYEHTELHGLMTDHQIPYVVLKGLASASCYPNPILRTFGDVDFLVHEADVVRAGQLLEENGFIPEEDHGGIHIGYHRDDTTWELHRAVNGIPAGKPEIAAALSDVIETAVSYEEGNGMVLLPDSFHHGLILLLHTASHLTSEGVGLRHLCDWATFAAGLSDGAFSDLFEEKLKQFGLWRFAQLLTLVSIRFLGAPQRAWVGEADPALLEELMTDILQGGNFGHKDEDRYRQIKYISNRGEGTVDSRAPLTQVLDTIRKKAELEQKSTVRVVGEYVSMVLTGRRKLDSKTTLQQADRRKQLYSALKLFQ